MLNFEATSSMLSTVRQIVPQVRIIDDNVAAFYTQARNIIRLITSVQHVSNNDPDVGDLLKVFFVTNYNFSLAEVIIRASDLSEHTSTVGMEASDRLTMKFLMNGGLIIWTMDSANIEIREETVEDNILTFGLLTSEIDSTRSKMKHGEYKVQDDCL